MQKKLPDVLQHAGSYKHHQSSQSMNTCKIRNFLLAAIAALIFFNLKTASAQSDPNAQVRISPSNLTVREAFSQLSKSAGLNFVYGNVESELDRSITLDPASGSVKQLLQQIAFKSGLTLTGSGRDIAVKLTPKGTVSGRVTTSDGEPARLVTVTIRGLRSTTVDQNGYYTFRHVPAGQYTLTATYVGLETQSQQVTVSAEAPQTANFELHESQQDLKEVVVSGSKVNKYGRKESEYIARLPIKNLENPQVYSVVRKELFTTQIATTLDETYRNIPGALVSRTGAGMPAITARGFTTGDNLRNGMATFLKTNIDPVIVERVESIKGPSSTLFGSTMVNFGGLVNYVIKKPYDTFGGEVSYTAGSFDLSRLTADVNVPLNQDKSLLFRVTGALHKENSFQDQGFQNLQVISPSFTYQINDRLKFTLDGDFTRVKGTSSILLTIPTNAFNGKSFKDLPVGYRQSLIDNSLASQQSSNNIFFQADYKISENWRSQTNYAYSLGAYDQFNQFDFVYTSESTINRKVRFFAPDKWGRKQLQQNFTGDFKTGPLRHRLVIGLDYLSQYRQLLYAQVNLDMIDLTKPIPGITLQQANNAFAAMNAPQSDSGQDSYAAYVSDLVNVTDRLMVMLSVRGDRFVNKGSKSLSTNVTTGDYKQTAYSPKFGLIYQPIKDKVSLFANYMNGFKNLPNAIQPDGTIDVFKVQQANQWEGGVKVDLLDHRIVANVSYYNIDVKNSTRFEIRDGQNFQVQDGTQKSKGVDFELIANPIRGLNIVAGYGYNDNKFTKAAPRVEGKRALLTPANVGNLWVNYTLTAGKLSGLGIGAGGNYVSSSYFANTGDYTFTLPAYTFIDAALFYDQPKYRLNFKANNIGDVQSWAIDGRPQKPVNFLASVAFKF
ncbi:TonB-dependent receptor [Mucilaginibacter sp. CAU 1740]|uniref:TonB-dependent receptor n=1 Tax=Mucilaginibacter sp. CAU 1740 TaxID=3140365 RepID=UPI00325BC21D